MGKKDRGHRSVINLKELEKSIPYANFNMEGLFMLKELLMPKDLMCKSENRSKKTLILQLYRQRL